MRSKRPSDLFSLDRDLRVVEEDVKALRACANAAALDLGDYLKQLTKLTKGITPPVGTFSDGAEFRIR